jgi:hypothetical protein
MTANATTVVTTGASDIVFSHLAPGRDPHTYLMRLNQAGTETLFHSKQNRQSEPDFSADGSKLLLISVLHRQFDIVTTNANASAPFKPIVKPTQDIGYDSPRWSPDGLWIAYIEEPLTISNPDGLWRLMKVRADGSGAPIELMRSHWMPGGLCWSPDGQRLVVSEAPDGLGQSQQQLTIIDADGTNPHPVDRADLVNHLLYPAWSPDGKTIFATIAVPHGAIVRLTSNDAFAGDNAGESSFDGGAVYGENLRLSGDGQTLLFDIGGSRVETVPTDGTAQPTVRLNSDGMFGADRPTFAPSPSEVSDAAVTIGVPALNDALLERSITVNLPHAGVKSYQYGWSPSETTPPSAPYQTAVKVSSGRGTLDYRATTPNSDWYLWIRPLNASSQPQVWATPVLVHTPETPIWVGLGDSYSSGHNQLSDNALCPRLSDAGTDAFAIAMALLCNQGNGPADLTPNDPTFSWVTRAVDRLNQVAAIPPDWTVTADLLAKSGATTTDMVNSQEETMAADLGQHAGSWNYVSLTGGADDADFSDALATFYSHHWTSLIAPWAVTSLSDCPDTQSVYVQAQAAQNVIRKNLSDIIRTATASTAGVKVLNVGYAYAVDKTNPCFADHANVAGVKSLIDLLNADHKAITGPNVHYVNLTASSSFGLYPISHNYIQKTRLYGYPHPSDSGQNLIATTAVGVAKG